MKIVNDKYPNLNLANEEDRGENWMIDFSISSFIAFVLAYFFASDFLLGICFYFIVRFIYYFMFECLSGRTLGKYQTQTKVVNIKGEKPSIYQLLMRTLSRFISGVSFVSDDELAIHDYLSKTYVVKETSLKRIETKKALLVVFVILFIGNIFDEYF